MDYPRRSIPSMSGLIAFEATARHLSFSRAADDLALTQGAVSKRVRQLETVLGFQLLVRNTNQVCLTDVGQTYLGHVRNLLRQLHASTEDIRATARGKVSIRVAAPSVFASRWLLPRLEGLAGALPDHTVNLMCACSPEDPRLAEVDCAILDGPTPWRDADAFVLASSASLVVASPFYLRDRELGTPSQLARATLLRCNRRPEMWAEWFAATGYNDIVTESAQFDDPGVMIEAALRGLGVAIVPQLLVGDELECGRLVSLFPERPARPSQYVLSVAQRSKGSEPVAAFTNWLVGRALQDMPPHASRQ